MPIPASTDATTSRRRRTRTALWIALGIAALLCVGPLARIPTTPFGVWVRSLAPGAGVRWQDAYLALGSPEASLPHDPRQREHLLLALAQAEDEPPRGLQVGARLHPPGTLAQLRYETFDAAGGRIDSWNVRALVPPLPDFASESGSPVRNACPEACRRELARRGGVLLIGSGDPGLSAEWVLRMPLAEPLELGARPLVTQDLFASTPLRVSIESQRVDGREVRRPASIRVTLLEACPATVWVGEVAQVQFQPDAIVPIPRSVETLRWVQLEGCEALAHGAPDNERARAGPAAPGAAPPTAEARGETNDRGVLLAQRDATTGIASIRVDEPWLERHGRSIRVEIREICRYEPVDGQWQRVSEPHSSAPVRLDPRHADASPPANRVLLELPRETGLFWFRWTETDVADPAEAAQTGQEGANGVGSPSWREALVVSGPILCNDVALGAAPAGTVAACVPFADRAEARIIPAPACYSPSDAPSR